MKKIAEEQGLSKDEVRTRVSDCWRHMMNVWFGGVSTELNEYISDYLEEDLKVLPVAYRITMDPIDMMRCTEKLFGLNANYAKGQGSEFEQWLVEYHPGATLYPTSRACGGARQDLCVEGAPALLMNIPLYLQYLYWRRMSAVGGKSDNILATKLFILLRSSEVVALLRVLSMLYISICLPIRWLAGKCHELKDYDFGYYDMGLVLTCMESAFEQILDEPELFFDEEFMMENLFKTIVDKVDPLREYLTHMFEEKSAFDVDGHATNDVLLDLLRAALLYPARADIIQTNDFCLELVVVAIRRFLAELRDETKVTHNYLESINGKYSLATISEEERQRGMGIEASNNISESVHASSTHSLKLSGTIRLDHAAAEGQTRANNDFGRDHEALIRSAHKRANDVPTERNLGFFLRLHPLIQHAMLIAGRRRSKETRRVHDQALQTNKQTKLNRVKIMQQKNAETKGEQWIEAMDYIEQYKSDRCWKSRRQAIEEYNKLDSEAKRLKAVKEQISIRKKGFGWDDAGHKWSENGYVYSSRELLDHFLNIVLSIEESGRPIPTEPQINLSAVDDSIGLGTMTALEIDTERFNVRTNEEFKQDMAIERARRENEGETDRATRLQRNVMPEFGESLIGFKIEFCFSYVDDEGGTYPAWCEGVVESIVSSKLRTVMIRWNADKVAEGDLLVSKHTLTKRGWNPKHAKENAWRAYVGELND